MPIGLVSQSASPAPSAPFSSSRSGCARPVTASPNFGSWSMTVCPPAMTPSPSAILSTAPCRRRSSGSNESVSGHATTLSAKRTSPPIAYTSDIAFAAAIAPEAYASSTIGGKKSTVSMIATSGATR